MNRFKINGSIRAVMATLMIVSAFSGCTQGVIEMRADYPYYTSEDELIQASDVIAVGKVIKKNDPQKLNILLSQTSASEDGQLLYTVFDVEVTEVIKGTVKPNETIQIKQLGDEANNPDLEIKEIDGYLKENKEYVLFLKQFGNNMNGEPVPFSLINPGQGLLIIEGNALKTVGNNQIIADNKNKDDVIAKLKEEVKK